MTQMVSPSGGPAVFDMDIGSDPDDTCVATFVLGDVARYEPALLLTNDETAAHGRARFLKRLVRAAGVDIEVAAGLPSARRRASCLVEDAGLAPADIDVRTDGVAALISVLESHPSVRYYSLGALSNLDSALAQRPDLAERAQLFQMGPALLGNYHRDWPQYNARLDPGAFVRAVTRVTRPTFVMSHSTWGAYSNVTRQQLGVYLDDPLAAALRRRSAVAALFLEHLDAWVKTGMPCTILHDPLTVLSSLVPGLVDFVDVELTVAESGWTSLVDDSYHQLRALLPHRGKVISRYLSAPREPVSGPEIACRLSLDTDHDRARETIATALLGKEGKEVATAWSAFNSIRNE